MTGLLHPIVDPLPGIAGSVELLFQGVVLPDPQDRCATRRPLCVREWKHATGRRVMRERGEDRADPRKGGDRTEVGADCRGEPGFPGEPR